VASSLPECPPASGRPPVGHLLIAPHQLVEAVQIPIMAAANQLYIVHWCKFAATTSIVEWLIIYAVLRETWARSSGFLRRPCQPTHDSTCRSLLRYSPSGRTGGGEHERNDQRRRKDIPVRPAPSWKGISSSTSGRCQLFTCLLRKIPRPGAATHTERLCHMIATHFRIRRPTGGRAPTGGVIISYEVANSSACEASLPNVRDHPRLSAADSRSPRRARVSSRRHLDTGGLHTRSDQRGEKKGGQLIGIGVLVDRSEGLSVLRTPV